MLPIYVSTTFFPDDSNIEDALNACLEHDIRQVELGSNHIYHPNPLQIRKKFDFSFLVHNYFPSPKESFVVNIASSNNDIYERSLQHVYNSIDFTKNCGALLYTFHPGFLSDPSGKNIDASNYDFRFEKQGPGPIYYENAFQRMTDSISRIADYAAKSGVRIAIESEGSFKLSNHLLMQRPAEYQEFFKHFSAQEIGINLNIGHLNLASKAFDFDKLEFVDSIADYIIAMELSHNAGIHDEHRPLVADQWYWQVITDKRFTKAFKILEFRNIPTEQVAENIELLKYYLKG